MRWGGNEQWKPAHQDTSVPVGRVSEYQGIRNELKAESSRLKANALISQWVIESLGNGVENRTSGQTTKRSWIRDLLFIRQSYRKLLAGIINR